MLVLVGQGYRVLFVLVLDTVFEDLVIVQHVPVQVLVLVVKGFPVVPVHVPVG